MTHYMEVRLETVKSVRVPLITGLLAAIGATACCSAPLIFVALGLGGAWMSSLRALEPYAPFFMAAAALFLGIAFYRLYILPRRCAPGAVCVVPVVQKRQRIAFWVVTKVVLLVMLFPFIAHWFY